MSDIAIRVENLSKKYSIGETIRQDTLCDKGLCFATNCTNFTKKRQFVKFEVRHQQGESS